MITRAIQFLASKRGQLAANHQPAPKGTNMATLSKILPIPQPEHGSSLWLQKIIGETKSPRLEVVDLTPQLAKTLLDLNPDNRSIRQTKVAQYAADMASGRWVLNGEPVIISADGRLNDGQHRCLAVIEANATVPMTLVFGIDRETRLTVDQGGARSASDFLSMEGVPNAATVGAIARMVIAYERNAGKSLTNASFITSAEIRDRVYSDLDLAHSASFAATNYSYSRQFAAGSLIGFAHYILCRVNRVEAEIFLAQMCRGDGLKMRSPIYTLREKLLSGRQTRDRKVKLILQAWNFHRRHVAKVAPSSMNSELPFPALV